MKIVIGKTTNYKEDKNVLGYARVLKYCGMDVRIIRQWENPFFVCDTVQPDVMMMSRPHADEMEAANEHKCHTVLIDEHRGFDALGYKKGKFDNALSCDLAFIGNYTDETAELIDYYLLPLCERTTLKVKVFGGGNWETPYWLGFLPEERIPDLVVSSKMIVDLNDTPKLSDRTLNTLGQGGYVLTNQEDGLLTYNIGGDIEEMVSINRPPNYTGRLDVLQNNTYFNRVVECFEAISPNVSIAVKRKYKELTNVSI